MTADWGRITTYDPSMAARVADMFTAFNELWPGGFGGGVPYDEQRVRDWLDRSTALADLIALDAQGEPVGYCGIYPHWRNRDAAYVSILGVVPRVKGQGYGRRLLLHAVEMVKEAGLRRLDLFTWSGNLDAVPLYKKVGMFWVPETSVYMQDYLPGLLSLPLAQEWFDKHPDWYSHFRRELTQAEDKQVVDGMELYTYVFQADGDRLAVEVDRYGWGFCGLDRELDGERIAVKARMRDHQILMGIPNAMTLAVTNEQGRDLHVSLAVEGFQGQNWREPFPNSLSIPAGQTVTVSREFVVDRTAQVHDREKRSETVRCRVILGEQSLELAAGGKIRPAVGLASQETYLAGLPGERETLYLDLINHAGTEIRGRVDAIVQGQGESHQSVEFALGPEESSGIHLEAALPTGSPAALLATPTIQVEDGEMAMPTYRHPLLPDSPALAAAVQGDQQDRILLVTDLLEATVHLEGGGIDLAPRGVPGMHSRVGFQAGPPFGMGPDETLRYAYETTRQGDDLLLTLRAESRQFPGVQVEKHLRVAAGRPEVEHWVTLTNLRAHGPAVVGGRLGTGRGFGLSLAPALEPARTFLPMGETIISSDAALPFMAGDVLDSDPAAWKESWIATESLAHGDLDAWFWKPDHVAKIRPGRAEVDARSLAPGEAWEVFHVWYGKSYPSVAHVRQRWSQLVAGHKIPWAEATFGPRTREPVEAHLAGDHLLIAGVEARRDVELRFATRYPVSGKVRIEAPPSWQAALVTDEGLRPTMALPQRQGDAPIRLEVAVTAPAAEVGQPGAIRLIWTAEFEMAFELPFLVMGSGDVRVEERQAEGWSLLAVENGALRFQVLDGRGGNLIRLEDAQGRSYLFDSFPEVAPRFFLAHHLGGIEPRVFAPASEEPFTELEAVRAEVAEEGPWRGARAAWTVRHRDDLRGQEYHVSYLTLPGVPVVRIRIDHHNPTPRRVRWLGVLHLDAAFQGSAQGLRIQAPGGTQVWTRYPARRGFFSPANAQEGWARLYREEQSLGMLAPAGSGGVVQAFDLQAMAGGFWAALRETPPGGQAHAEHGLALGMGPEEIDVVRRALERGSGR